MKFAGIIAEYDPFHSGHAWQLARAREMGAERIAVVMSCGATQRGALPLLPEPVRVQAALAAGADLVFALPAPYANAGAESFARAGAYLLAAAGCDTLIFGAETPDTGLLTKAARLLLSDEYRESLRAQLNGGARSFAAARQAALAGLCPELGGLLAMPNNNLAIEYCKAILELELPLTPVALPRVGAGHGEAAPCTNWASGSALRALWTSGGAAALTPYVPEKADALYRAAEKAGMYTDAAAVNIAVMSRLRARAAIGGFVGVRSVSEGLENALEKAVRGAATMQDVLDALTTVRYPRARVRRLVMDAALGYGGGQGWLDTPALPPYLHLLGGRRESLPVLKDARLPASSSLARLAAENEDCRRTAAAQAAACDLATLCRHTSGSMGEAYTRQAVIL